MVSEVSNSVPLNDDYLNNSNLAKKYLDDFNKNWFYLATNIANILFSLMILISFSVGINDATKPKIRMVVKILAITVMLSSLSDMAIPIVSENPELFNLIRKGQTGINVACFLVFTIFFTIGFLANYMGDRDSTTYASFIKWIISSKGLKSIMILIIIYSILLMNIFSFIFAIGNKDIIIKDDRENIGNSEEAPDKEEIAIVIENYANETLKKIGRIMFLIFSGGFLLLAAYISIFTKTSTNQKTLWGIYSLFILLTAGRQIANFVMDKNIKNMDYTMVSLLVAYIISVTYYLLVILPYHKKFKCIHELRKKSEYIKQIGGIETIGMSFGKKMANSFGIEIVQLPSSTELVPVPTENISKAVASKYVKDLSSTQTQDIMAFILNLVASVAVLLFSKAI